MKGMDGSIQTILSGSSGCFMDTYMTWDRETLETCWNDVDMIACHLYIHNRENQTAWYLAEGRFIDDYRALVRPVAAELHPTLFPSTATAFSGASDEHQLWQQEQQLLHGTPSPFASPSRSDRFSITTVSGG
jgi:alpha-L-arabinofuranosidase